MEIEAYITIAIILIALFLFATEYFTVDLVALAAVAALVITGVLTTEEGVKGFANPATITVAAMFVLSDSLLRTGILQSVGPFFARLFQKSYYLSVSALMLFVGSLSAFINNTPVVATFIPVITKATEKSKYPASKFLIPLSYGAIFGGSCTLIGTSTNLLVSGIARDKGLEPFSMFLLAPLGITLLVVGVLYILFFGNKLLPSNRSGNDIKNIGNIKNYISEIQIGSKLNSKNNTIQSIFLRQGLEVTVQQVMREDQIFVHPSADFVLQENDVLIIKGDLDRIKTLLQSGRINISESLNDLKFPEEETRLIEIVILPNSYLNYRKLRDVNFSKRYQANVLAIRQRGRERFDNLDDIIIKAGDILILQTNEKGYEWLNQVNSFTQPPFISMRESGVQKLNKPKLVKVALSILAAILLATFEVLPIMVGALCAIVYLVVSGIISMADSYRAIDWKVIILLAGSLALGEAMDKSGLSAIVAGFLQNQIGELFGPIAIVSLLYLFTSLLTEIMSNNAAVALLAPIAISIAAAAGLSPLPFLMAITFAGSASFMTPIGYQTNTMVYSAGDYQFKDFLRVGTPLNILFWIIASFLIPVFYPF